MDFYNRFMAWWRALRPWQQCAFGVGASWIALDFGYQYIRYVPGSTVIGAVILILGACCAIRMVHDTCLYMLEALNAKHELDRLKSLPPHEVAAYLEHRKVQEILSLPPTERARRYPEEMRAANELARVLSPEQMLELLERSNVESHDNESRRGAGGSLRNGTG